jgi:tetratricopeptide (TPR) repeat protein
LGLKAGASFEEIKASYRRLARQYHPDVNPGDRQAKDKFIEVTSAYQFLLANATSENGVGVGSTAPKPPAKPIVRKKQPLTTLDSQPDSGARQVSIQFNANLSAEEQRLKAESYAQLQKMLKEHRFPRATALVEGLVKRFPQDSEVMQWQAIVYQRWGRHLIQTDQLDKARIYLKKALRTDPHNRSLWAEVERDFQQLEQLF